LRSYISSAGVARVSPGYGKTCRQDVLSGVDVPVVPGAAGRTLPRPGLQRKLRELPDDAKGRHRAEDLAARLNAALGDARMSYGQAGHTLGVHPNSLRYTAATGTLLIRWEGARLPVV
jgi:hypothetical protein